jgi:hypothetical protein
MTGERGSVEQEPDGDWVWRVLDRDGNVLDTSPSSFADPRDAAFDCEQKYVDLGVNIVDPPDADEPPMTGVIPTS